MLFFHGNNQQLRQAALFLCRLPQLKEKTATAVCIITLFTTSAKIATERMAVKGFRGISRSASLHYLFHVPLTAMPSYAFSCLSGD
jgi:hypothetical protein